MGNFPLAFAELAVVDAVRQTVYAFNKVTPLRHMHILPPSVYHRIHPFTLPSPLATVAFTSSYALLFESYHPHYPNLYLLPPSLSPQYFLMLFSFLLSFLILLSPLLFLRVVKGILLTTSLSVLPLNVFSTQEKSISVCLYSHRSFNIIAICKVGWRLITI